MNDMIPRDRPVQDQGVKPESVEKEALVRAISRFFWEYPDADVLPTEAAQIVVSVCLERPSDKSPEEWLREMLARVGAE